MNTNFMLRGANEMIRSLEKMNVETHSKIRLAFEKVAKDIEKDAKKNAPVARKKGKQGGTLRRSIKSKVNANPARIEARIGTDVHYAPYQEEGTSRGIPAIHYLRDAYESNLAPFLMKLESIIHSLRW